MFTGEGIVQEQLSQRGPDFDFTKHIEPDWDVNPETMNLCIRYKGRRVTSLNVASADSLFCMAYVDPVETPEQQTLDVARECVLEDLLQGRLIYDAPGNAPILVQAYGKPNMRYVAAAWYNLAESLTIASNCVRTALARALERTNQTEPGDSEVPDRNLVGMGLPNFSVVVIAGDGYSS